MVCLAAARRNEGSS